MNSKQVLVIEDDESNAKLISLCLKKEGFNISTVERGEEGLNYLMSSPKVDLVLLDVSLPGIDGFETCRRIREMQRFKNLPIIFLTGRDHIVDRVSGFDIGADDYITKPFEIIELILRVKAVLKRSFPPEEKDQIIKYGNLNIDLSRHKVMVENTEIFLTAMEFRLLVVLVKRQGKVQTRDTLLSDVWETNQDVTTRTIDEHIVHLRRKLGQVGDSIETVRGYGYRLKEMDE